MTKVHAHKCKHLVRISGCVTVHTNQGMVEIKKGGEEVTWNLPSSHRMLTVAACVQKLRVFLVFLWVKDVLTATKQELGDTLSPHFLNSK